MPNAVLMAARFQFRTSPLSKSSNNMRRISPTRLATYFPPSLLLSPIFREMFVPEI